MISAADLVGKTVTDPIQNSLVGGGALRAIWDQPQKSRVKGNMQNIGLASPWRYTLLKYNPGLVTYCGMHAPVITGWMSGCFLFRFLYHGQRYAAHVGTDDSDEEKNAKAKSVWKALADRPSVSDIWGYNPAKSVSIANIMAVQRAGSQPKIAGYWEQNGAMRILTFGSPLHGATSVNQLMVYGVDLAPLQPWSVIRNDPKFA